MYLDEIKAKCAEWGILGPGDPPKYTEEELNERERRGGFKFPEGYRRFLVLGEPSPCTEEEVEVLEQQIGHRLPEAYREFLLWMGWGSSFASCDLWAYDFVMELNDKSISVENENKLFREVESNEAFIFLDHESYYYAFFYLNAGDDPPTYDYAQGHEFAQTSGSFTQWLMQRLEFEREFIKKEARRKVMTTTQTGTRPKPSTLQIWWLASRPNTLPAAIVPVLVGAALAAHDGQFRPLAFVATLLASLLIQIGTNLANDLFDFEKGADTAERLGPPRITSAGWVPPATVRRVMIGVFAAAALLGLYLIAVGGWPILVVGVLSIICAVAYTGGPWPLGYHGLGEVFVFLFFGVVAVAGTYFVQTGAVTPLALIVSVPVGLLCTAIIVANNIRDIETDRKAGKRTLAVRIGRNNTRALYTACIAVSYLIVIAIWPLAGRTWAALPALTVGLAVTPVMTIWRETAGPPLIGVLKQTARLHLIFGVLFALGILWGGFR